MYDVIVVGSGPAGCAAAKTLSQKGLRVLLAERFRMPRYKSCSGQLIHKTLELVEEYFGVRVPDEVTCTPAENRGMVLTDGWGRTMRFEQPGKNVWRGSFDQWLARQAAQAGTEIREGTGVVSCVQDGQEVRVQLREERTYEERCRWLLDCEGVTGGLKRQLLPGPREYITTFQTFSQGSIDLDPHYFYAFLQPELSEYDAWFNVKDELLVLGVAVRDAAKIGHYYPLFLDFMTKTYGLQLTRQRKEDKWLLPRVRPGCALELGVGRVLFAGEAAGFLNPMGEGISAALESGRWCAQAVLDRFGQPELALEDYRQAVQPLWNYMRRQWSFTAGLADTFDQMRLPAQNPCTAGGLCNG